MHNTNPHIQKPDGFAQKEAIHLPVANNTKYTTEGASVAKARFMSSGELVEVVGGVTHFATFVFLDWYDLERHDGRWYGL